MKKTLSSRITTLQNRFIDFGIDTLMVSVEENRRYLSGFTGHDGQFDETAGALLISADRLILATDGRYTLQAEKEAPHFEITTYDMGLPKALPDLTDKLKSKRLGIESDRMSVSQFNKISEMVKANGLKTTIVPTTNMVETLRIKKDTEEIGLTKDALVCAEAAFLKVIETLQPEMTEAEIAWNLEKTIRESSDGGLSFPPIVAAGPNSALPHAMPGNRKINVSEPILFDWGARKNGYCSDTSRTVVLERPGSTFLSVYKAVRTAQEKAIASIKPGMNGKEVDAIARTHIDSAGFGGYFNHGLGHGTGLAIHENPRLGPTSDSVLTPGMICTVEPGVYIPKWGGIRLENQVVVTETGCDVLNQLDLDDFCL